jgi:hypothetical protein
MNLYNKNLSFFREKSEQLYSILTMDSPTFNVKLERLENSLNYIVSNDDARCFIHSVYDIENEMKMMFRSVNKDTDTIVLFGLGCGYSFEYIAKNFSSVKRLIIIEPSLEIFRNLLHEVDIEKLISKIPTVTFVVNQSAKFTSELITNSLYNELNMDFVYNISYRTLFKEYYETIVNEFLKNIRVKRSDVVTVAASVYAWLRNSIENFKQDCLPIEEVAHIFKDRPAVLVAAGPSLNKNMHLINDLKKKAIVIAVGSAIKILDANGIEPHFRMAVDGLEREKKFLEGINTENVPLLFGNKLYYEILPEYKGKKIRFIDHTDYIGQYVYEKAQLSFLEVRMGASIANGALNFMCQSGCSHIIFMGQDLCYTDGEVHAKGAHNDEDYKLDSNSKRFIKTKDIFGNDVYTTNEFLSMKYMLDRTVSNFPKIKYINATEGGIGVEGTKIKPLAKVLQEDLIGDLKIDFNDLINNLFLQHDSEYSFKIEQAISAMKEDVKDIITINEERLKYINKIKKNMEKEVSINRILNDLTYLNTFENKLNNNKFYSSVILLAMLEVLKSIQLTFKYSGEDKTRQAESIEKIVSNISILIKQFAEIALNLVEKN